MAGQMERLTFGKPETAEQAYIRLPERDNPLYGSNETIQHLAHLKEWYVETYTKICRGVWSKKIEDRFIPLGAEDLDFIKNISFSLRMKLAEARWEFVPEDLCPWCDLFSTGDNEYRHWTIFKVLPQPELPPGILFIGLEADRGFDFIDWQTTDSNPDYELGWTNEAELEILKKSLTRNLT